MNLLKNIIDRLNQRVEVANIFDQIYPLCELNANGNEKAWVHYIGNGQAEVVTNFDAKQGTLFWAKRGKVSVSKTESLKVSGCKTLYLTTFPLTAYAVVRKSHLPCDSEDSQDWIASRIYRLISGTDPDFKSALAVIQYEVIPNGYVNEIKSLTANYEWACVAVDVDVAVVSASEDGCYDICATGDIPLPDLQPCQPCLTEVAVDGVTIIGNGTSADPLVAIGGGGGGGIKTAIAFSTDHLASTGNQYVIGNVVWYNGNIYRCIAANDSILPTNATYWTNLGAGFETIERPVNWNATSGNNQILNKPSIPPAQINSDWNSSSGLSQILNKPTIPTATSDLTNDSGFITSADVPTLTSELTNDSGFITSGDIPPQVNADWNASSGVEEILNKPTIPDATLLVPYTGATADVELGANDIYAGKHWLYDAVNDNYGSIHFTDTDFHIEDADGHKMLVIEDGFMQIHLSDTIQSNLFTSDLTETRDHYLPDASGTIALTSDIVNQVNSDWNATTGLSQILNKPTLAAVATSGSYNDLSNKPTIIPTSRNIGTSAPLTGGGDLSADRTISITKATGSVDGYLAATDFTTFAAKQDALVSSTNIKTINSTSVLGSGNIAVEPTISAGTISQYYRGDKTFQTLDKNAVGLANVDNTSDANKPISTATQTALNGKQATLVSGTNIKTINSTSLLGSGDIAISSFGVYKNTTNGAASSLLLNTFSSSVLVPANSVVAGNILEFKLRGIKTGTGNTYTIRLYANSANNLTGAVLLGVYSGGQTGAFGQQMVRTGVVKNATTNTEMMSTAVTNVGNDFQNTTFSPIAVDWTSDKYIIGAVQNAIGTDSSLISFISMTII